MNRDAAVMYPGEVAPPHRQIPRRPGASMYIDDSPHPWLSAGPTWQRRSWSASATVQSTGTHSLGGSYYSVVQARMNEMLS